ncbi:hypothetical protein [Flammeovirga agarivorans]|uniref:Uncharacterized protein n=1 Tax=Flammeovirga agarivorans TaxID=2726742 RepID=A0A7X8XW55_9BACT|nr:hypothetical protein [Flammeovirga agarivorans]NLR91921.1 hypothetical protein [Flammeovirga agarivorans]
MKTFRLFTSLSVMLLMVFAAQTSIAQSKAQKKEIKAKLKYFKKEKAEVIGSSRSLEVLLEKHYAKLDAEGYEETIGVSENCPTTNLCIQHATNNAQVQYATLANSFLKGKMVSESGLDAARQEGAMDKFYAAYEKQISSNLSGILKQSFAVKTKDRFEIYFLIDEDGAARARRQALERAVEESRANQEWANSASNFINQSPDSSLTE